MFGTAKTGASAYARVGVETGVTAASPHQLIVMLFDGALIALANAQQHIKSGNIAEKGTAISKAIMIIESGLRASLNKEVGGEIAANLDGLYEYMSGRLFQANLKTDLSLVEEVYGLLADLRGAWQAIDPAGARPVGTAPVRQAAAPALYGNLAKA